MVGSISAEGPQDSGGCSPARIQVLAAQDEGERSAGSPSVARMKLWALVWGRQSERIKRGNLVKLFCGSSCPVKTKERLETLDHQMQGLTQTEIKLHPGEKSQEMTQGFVSVIQVICLCFKPPAPTGISLPSRIWGLQDSHHPLGYFMEQSQPSPRKILPADIRGWQAEQRGQGFKGP